MGNLKITKPKMRLNNKFYSEESIKQTIEAFTEVCETTYSIEKRFFDVEIKTVEDIETVEKEFDFLHIRSLYLLSGWKIRPGSRTSGIAPSKRI